MSEPHLPSSSRSEPSRAALGIIFLIVLIDLMGFGIIIPLLPFYVHDPKNNPMKVTLLIRVASKESPVAHPGMERRATK